MLNNFIIPLNGQSNYDLSLMGYGNLDNFIKLCSDNLIGDTSVVNTTSYKIDNTVKNINTNFSNTIYATSYKNTDSRVYGDAYGDAYS